MEHFVSIQNESVLNRMCRKGWHTIGKKMQKMLEPVLSLECQKGKELAKCKANFAFFPFHSRKITNAPGL